MPISRHPEGKSLAHPRRAAAWAGARGASPYQPQGLAPIGETLFSKPQGLRRVPWQVALDELGRGTSTSDGAAIAGAVLEHLTSAVGCRCGGSGFCPRA